MLKGVAATAAAAALTACQPKVVEKIVKETVIVEKEVIKEIEKADGELKLHYITQLWNWQKLNMATATDQYNINNRGKIRVEVDPSPDGWQTKVIQMIKDDNLEWDGMLRIRNLGDVADYTRAEMVQPWDPYINGSNAAWAPKFWDELPANIRESFSKDGKLYGLPWDLELFCRVYRKPEWDALGEGTKPAETLEEFENQLLELKKIFPDKTPMALAHWSSHPDQQMLMQLWTDDPWVHDDELNADFFDVQGDAYKQYLSLLKRWWDSSIIDENTWGTGNPWHTPWRAGDCCTVQTGAAWAQAVPHKLWGRANVIPTTNFVLNKGDQPKTFSFGNAGILFNGAKNPQEITDWLLWMIDPTIEKVANYSFHKGDLNYYHLPAYKSIYDNIIPKNTEWIWMQEMYDMVAASATVPLNAHLAIFGPIADEWEEKFVHGNCTMEECIEAIYTGEREAIRKGTGPAPW
jgi:ABC-type glycerol-3-phosphate transport system substrate-binding protein